MERSIDANIAARAGAIGPAPHPANNEYLALNGYKWVVPAMDALLPGSICEDCVPKELSPINTWGPRALAELVERLGGAVLSSHSQSSDVLLHMLRLLRERGQLGLVKGILVPETTVTGTESPHFSFERFGITPKDFDTIPYLIFSGDYRITSVRANNRDFIDKLNASPTRSVSPAGYFDLDDPQFSGKYRGSTHLVQMGSDNIALLDFLLDWADENIANPMVANAVDDRNDE